MRKENYYRLQGRKPKILGHENLAKSAVTVPLVQHEGEVKLLFEERAMTLNRQPGEICFPGGAVESTDSNPAQAAIRETCEELGISREAMELIAPLDLFITPYNALIYPYLCEIKDFSQIRPNSSEVKSVFLVPLKFFMSTSPIVRDIKVYMSPPEDFPFHLIPKGRDYDWRTGTYRIYLYIFEGKPIWGMTARILKHFLSLIEAG